MRHGTKLLSTFVEVRVPRGGDHKIRGRLINVEIARCFPSKTFIRINNVRSNNIFRPKRTRTYDGFE